MAKILVCDDDKEIVEAIEIYLTQDGHQVLEAYDGIEAPELSDAVFLCGPFCEKCNTGQTAVCPVLL